MGYKRVKTGVKQYQIRYNFYARKKKGERREKKFKISCFFVKHKFCKNKNNINKYYILYNIYY